MPLSQVQDARSRLDARQLVSSKWNHYPRLAGVSFLVCTVSGLPRESYPSAFHCDGHFFGGYAGALDFTYFKLRLSIQGHL